MIAVPLGIKWAYTTRSYFRDFIVVPRSLRTIPSLDPIFAPETSDMFCATDFTLMKNRPFQQILNICISLSELRLLAGLSVFPWFM